MKKINKKRPVCFGGRPVWLVEYYRVLIINTRYYFSYFSIYGNTFILFLRAHCLDVRKPARTAQNEFEKIPTPLYNMGVTK